MFLPCPWRARLCGQNEAVPRLWSAHHACGTGLAVGQSLVGAESSLYVLPWKSQDIGLGHTDPEPLKLCLHSSLESKLCWS
jgi:hypothetical protein